jgi:hypothetical protein
MTKIGVQAMMLKKQFELDGPFATLKRLSDLGFSGSSELGMVGACSVGSSSVGGEHDSQSIMIKVFEAVG